MNKQSSSILQLSRVTALILGMACGMHCFAQMPEAAAALDRFTVTVLPAAVLSEDPRHAELASLVDDELLSQLGAIEGIHHIDPRVVKSYEDSSLTPVEVARKLGAGTVIESSVSPGTDGVTITVRTTDANTGKLRFSMGSTQRDPLKPDSSLEAVRRMASKVAQSVERHIYPERRPGLADKRASARAAFLDTSQNTADRLKALDELSPPRNGRYPLEYIDGGEALGGAVASAAAEIAAGSGDPGVKIHVWRNMMGVPDPVLVPPLMYSLANDSNARVRAVAAEALTEHLELQGVREALQTAGTSDPDEKVRKAALFAMLTRVEMYEQLGRSVMDEDLSDMERRMALFRLTRVHSGTSLPVDEELVQAIAQIGQVSSSTQLRQTAWFSLVQLVEHEAAVYLTGALKSEPNEAIRANIVSMLSRYMDEPGVHDIVADAESNDRSAMVRDAASRALRGDSS